MVCRGKPYNFSERGPRHRRSKQSAARTAQAQPCSRGLVNRDGCKLRSAVPAWNKRALGTAERFEREGLAALNSASRERSMVSHRDASGLVRAARGMLTQRDARVIEILPEIKVPALIVVGADDAPFLAASDYMAAKIPGARKAVIPAAGHAVNIDQPQAFIDAVLPFLDGLPHAARQG